MCLWDSNAETLRTDVFPAGFFNHEKMGVVFESSDHQLYFLPDKGNLCISDLTMTRFSRLPQGTLLDNKYSMFVLEDAEHRLWIGTGNWLYRYDRRQTIIPYGYIDGIPSPVFTLCPPVIDGNGCLWMGNSKGLIYADFERLHTGKQYHYPPTITEQRVVGRNNVTFRFSDFTYSDPSYTAYEYRLEGYDHTWHTTTSMSEATYYNLPPGKYTFHLRHIGEPAGETRQALYIAYPDMLFTLLTVAALLLLSSFLLYLFMHRRRQAVASKAELTAAPKVEQQEKDPAKKYQTYHISAEECERLLTTLDEVMRRNKSYTNPNLKITDLAALAGSSPPILSYLFNQYLQRNYYDYINDYRIEEFKRLVAGKDAERYTLAALAEQCGFSSRTSFFRSFKKATGITPNEYMTKITRPNTNAS
jgi:AraC-like DNA-binding protein